MMTTATAPPARSLGRASLAELIETGGIYVMSATEKWKFYLPIMVTIVLASVPGVVIIKSDLAVVKHDIGAIHSELPQLVRKDVAALEHQKIVLELKILDQKLEQLKSEFRTQCEMWVAWAKRAQNNSPK